MRYVAILWAGSLLACASNNNAPAAASASSVQAATSTPFTGPSFAPVGSDAEAAAPADARTATTSRAATRAGSAEGANTDSAPSANGNATALPAQSPPTSAYEADNSRVNARDRSGDTLTPMNQGSGESDRRLTQQIRRAVVGDSTLSFTAKNVKIITINGKVTLRGAVKTDEERMKIAAAARKVAGDAQVENFLEVSK